MIWKMQAGSVENNDEFKLEDAGWPGVADDFEPDSKANSLGWESVYLQAKQNTNRLAHANGKKEKRAFWNEVQEARAIANLRNKKAKVMLWSLVLNVAFKLVMQAGHTVAQKTAPMFAYYIKTHVLLNTDIISIYYLCDTAWVREWYMPQGVGVGNWWALSPGT